MLRFKICKCLLALLLVQLAPASVVLAASIESVTTCTKVNESGLDAADVRSEFDSQTPEIHAVVHITDVKAGDKLTGSWVFLDSVQTPNFLMGSSDAVFNKDGKASVHFVVSKPPAGWLPGKYKLDLYWEGAVIASAPFSVKAAPGAETAEPGKPKLESLVTCEGVAGPDSQPMKVTSKFNPLTPEIHAIATIGSVRPGSKVKGVWVSVNALPVPNYEMNTSEIVLDKAGTGRVHFQISRPHNGWNKGHYKVDLYIDGKMAGSAPFSIELPATGGS
jgi:hypothetical protein